MEATIDAIEKRCAAATEGPWTRAEDGPATWRDDVLAPDGSILVEAHGLENAEFIAHTRVDVSLLCAEVRRLRARVETLNEKVENQRHILIEMSER